MSFLSLETEKSKLFKRALGKKKNFEMSFDLSGFFLASEEFCLSELIYFALGILLLLD